MSSFGRRRLILSDLRGNAAHFVLASVGTVLGIAALTFFVGLGLGSRSAVMRDAYPGDLVEVAPKSIDLDLWALRLDLASNRFGDHEISQLQALPEVAAVYAKMQLAVPAVAAGGEGFLGARFTTEVLVEGIDPALVAAEVGVDFDLVDPTDGLPCAQDSDCGEGTYCSAWSAYSGGRCRTAIPALISPRIVELYNGPVRKAYGLPKLNPEAAVGLSCDLLVGASTLPGTARLAVERERLRLVGVSELAIGLGVSVPLEAVRRLNQQCAGGGAEREYSSAVLRLRSKDALASVASQVEDLGLEVVERGASRAATLMAVLLVVFGMLSVLIVLVAAINIMHVFMIHVAGRGKEIGVMRVLGARRRDIRFLILSEAALVGLFAGVSGAALGVVGGKAAEVLADQLLPRLPGLPESLFHFNPWVVAAVVVLAVVAAVLGAALPAARAAAKDPSRALRGL